MPGKKNQKMNVSNNNSNNEAPVVSVQEPVQESVQEAVVVAAVVEKKKRAPAKKAVTAVEAPMVQEPVQEVKETKKASGKGKAKKAQEPVVETQAQTEVALEQVQEPSKKRQAGGRKKAETVAATEPAAPVVKKTRAPKVKKADSLPVEAADATQTAGEVVVDDEKQIRSFKVKLPGSEQFEGRFTGLTPYQAANKALSKYFREGQREDGEVTFSICESTRKSKKSVYTYVGQRHKLLEPVKYTIQNGREIIKNFKNSLKKVKKAENAPVVATV
jgi:hypothetical protein